MTQGRVHFQESIGELGVAGDPTQLGLEHRRRHRRVPELLQRHGLLQVASDPCLGKISRDRFPERLRGADLVGVVDALDRLLRNDTFLKRQRSTRGMPPTHGDEKRAGDEDGI